MQVARMDTANFAAERRFGNARTKFLSTVHANGRNEKNHLWIFIERNFRSLLAKNAINTFARPIALAIFRTRCHNSKHVE